LGTKTPKRSTIDEREIVAVFLYPELFVADVAVVDVAKDDGEFDDSNAEVELVEEPDVDAEEAEPLGVDAAKLLDWDVSVTVAFAE